MQLLYQGIHLAVQQFAPAGQLQLATAPLEELLAQRLLQVLDLVAHGGRGDVQVLRRQAEALMARGDTKRAQSAQGNS